MDLNINNMFSNYSKIASEYEELESKLINLTGRGLEETLRLFASGYELCPPNYGSGRSWCCDPYKHHMADAYVTAVNILAVEYLIKTKDEDEYDKRSKQLNELSDLDLEMLYFELSLNKHTSSLGAMITQGDYDSQKENLLWFLDDLDDRV